MDLRARQCRKRSHRGCLDTKGEMGYKSRGPGERMDAVRGRPCVSNGGSSWSIAMQRGGLVQQAGTP
jgi:hypothetical protein